MSTDHFFKIFFALRQEWETLLPQIKTEEDVRFQVIDRMLIEVLGWKHADILKEPPSTFGAEVEKERGYIDYLLKDGSRNLLVLEAKRKDFNLLDTQNTKLKPYDLFGPTLKPAQGGIRQAQLYCLESAVDIAVLTNGFQWIFFRAARGDGLAKDQQKAIVFPSFDAIDSEFASFYELFSKEGIVNNYYEKYLAKYEESVHQTSDTFVRVVTDDKVKLINKPQLAHDLEPVLRKFFTQMSSTDDPEMLRECFVDTPESDRADVELAKIMDKMYANISAVNKEHLASITKTMLANLQETPNLKTTEVVLIVGKPGAGKTTFIDRFFKQVLNPAIRKECVVVKINLSLFQGGKIEELPVWLSDKIKNETEDALFADGAPSPNDLKAIFSKEFNKGVKCDWALDNKTTQQKKFLQFMGNMKTNKVFDYIIGLINNGIIGNRRKLPCIIFDNADLFSQEMQECIFQYAQSIKQQTNHLLLICPITPDSLWGLKRTSVFESYFTKQFYLPVPMMKDILSKRIRFIKAKISEARKNKAVSGTTTAGQNYFLRNGIRVSIDNIEGFSLLLEDIFINQEFITRFIGKLSNFQIRKSLELLANIITSPHIPVDELIGAYIKTHTTNQEHQPIKQHTVWLAAIKESYNYYDYNNKFIRNIFSFEPSIITSPLLKLRVLKYLQERASHTGTSEERGYIAVESAEAFFKPLGIRSSIFYSIINELFNQGFIERYDPSQPKNIPIRKIAITDSGLQHLELGLRNSPYISQMGIRTPIREEAVILDLRALLQERKDYLLWRKILKRFCEYCISEDKFFIPTIPTGEEYEGQREILKALTRWLSESGLEVVR